MSATIWSLDSATNEFRSGAVLFYFIALWSGPITVYAYNSVADLEERRVARPSISAVKI